MLYLTRRLGEAVVINNEIEVHVVELRGRTVKLGFSFPTTASIMRKEVFDQVRAENEAAAAATLEGLPEDELERVSIELDPDGRRQRPA
jgi:carbon storage regulator